MHKNLHIDEKIIKNIFRNNVKPTKDNVKLNLNIYYKNKKTSNFVIKNNPMPTEKDLDKSNIIYQFTCPFQHKNNTDHQYIGMTTTSLNKRLNSHKYNGGIKQHLFDHHKTKINLDILTSNTKIIDKDEDRKRLYIREALIINKLKPVINTQYNNFSNILKLHNNTQNNFQKHPSRKQDLVINENMNENITETNEINTVPPPTQIEVSPRAMTSLHHQSDLTCFTSNLAPK